MTDERTLQPADLKRLKVLVVDDSAHMRKLVVTILQAFGVSHIHEAENAERAWSLLLENNPDICILDWMMEGMSGLELTQKIHGPVVVGDTIRATVTVTGIRPTSKSGRAVVDSSIEVFNQRNELVMTYTARRLLAGR